MTTTHLALLIAVFALLGAMAESTKHDELKERVRVLEMRLR
jgi:hypothetical protein